MARSGPQGALAPSPLGLRPWASRPWRRLPLRVPFLDFFYNLRAQRVPVSTHNWLALMQAPGKGLHGDSLEGFYQVARGLLGSGETH